MLKKWFGASLLILVLALTGCSEDKAKPEEKPKSEQKEKNTTADKMEKQQADVIKHMKKTAVVLDPKTLESDSNAYDKKIIKATGTVSSEAQKMGGSFEFKVGDAKYKVMNFTMDNSIAQGAEITIYGNVKNGKDAKTGLPTLNATYVE
ncbi:hypothetical protein [Bacillus sp. NEB1478]|uniref:hypothetical protein n=1 Tax=Bacillus sp. NEB1478 TaxID=3073816 RepID=UPI002872BEBF|nr:hypothetical protein [Bacillus sp. NEB1478]WNB92302.1 hypothetical protein RGB74_01175 [Bacillus sp. NEB1478]